MKKSPFLAAIAAAVSCVALTACGTSANTALQAPASLKNQLSAANYAAVTLILGVRGNTPVPVMGGAVADAVDAAINSGAPVTVIVNDGAPTVQAGLAPDVCGSDANCVKANNAKVDAFSQQLRTLAPKTAESDLLAAEQLAGRTMSTVPGRKLLVVADNGLSTTGKVRMQEAGMLSADPADLSIQLAGRGELPALESTDVILTGIGDTMAPQQPLNQVSRQNVARLWTMVAKDGKASSVQVIDGASSGKTVVNPLPVALVPVPDDGPIKPAPVAGQQPGKVVAVLSEDRFPFVPDQAVLIDPVAAKAALAEVAAYAVQNKLHLNLTGCTSSAGEPGAREALALKRAETIKELLVGGLGVDPAMVTTEGAGSNFPGFVQDRDAAGQLLAGPAALNRKVIVATR